MENNYIITVVGKQTVDGESDKIEVITEGDIRETGDKLVITYPEYPEDDPQKKTDTTVTLDGGILSIERKGEMSSHLILEQGKRHECLYQTPMGQMFIGIFTNSIAADIGENGGEITAAYQLDFNRVVVSYNEFYISVKAK